MAYHFHILLPLFGWGRSSTGCSSSKKWCFGCLGTGTNILLTNERTFGTLEARTSSSPAGGCSQLMADFLTLGLRDFLIFSAGRCCYGWTNGSGKTVRYLLGLWCRWGVLRSFNIKSLYHLALWVNECAVRYCRALRRSWVATGRGGILTRSRSFWSRFGNSLELE